MTINEMQDPYRLTITTGKVLPTGPAPGASQEKAATPQASFAEVLQQELQGEKVQASFSKHAQTRLVERNIDLTENNKLERLNNGIELAQKKGLQDTLILVDRTAFIVNAQTGAVITTVAGEELQSNVFTNINGTVII